MLQHIKRQCLRSELTFLVEIWQSNPAKCKASLEEDFGTGHPQHHTEPLKSRTKTVCADSCGAGLPLLWDAGTESKQQGIQILNSKPTALLRLVFINVLLRLAVNPRGSRNLSPGTVTEH